ncbi:DUF6302 family protein [Streptomyces sp. NPDC014872]|uniref:DUF6302 family protein n=1 Tax=Streptomyces sp. NPDC014872 TaxID=3364926 RepID=UPI0036F4FB18
MSSPLAVPAPRLLPPEQAYDYEFWARRLVDPGLLRGAVAVALFRAPLLAVPTGATRRGGQLHMVQEVFALQTAAALEGLPGFAELSHSGPIVEWGDQPPALCRPDECRQFYGLLDPSLESGSPSMPPAGHTRHGSETGRQPLSTERVSGHIPPPREPVATVAATLL